MTRFLLLAICLAVPAFAQFGPTIRSIVNAASNTDPLLPNSSIARGSMFVIKGEDLGPPIITADTVYPLGTTFQGTSVKVQSQVNNQFWDAIIYYSGAKQVAAILPSTVPEGLANIRVTYNGQTSQNYQITVVKTSVGLFTANSSGAGDAIAYNQAIPVPLMPANPARPGDTIILWGTGLGPVDADETGPAPQFDMTSVPVEAWVGGKPATILFRGRNACCTAVDTVYLRVPTGIGGCMTPVTLKAGNTYSNTVLIPTAQSGSYCTPTTPSVTAAEMPQLVSKTNLWFGALTLIRSAVPSNTSLQPVGSTFDGGIAVFTQAQVFPGWFGYTDWDILHPRTCNATTTGGFNGYFSQTALSAGTINVNGPTGAGTLNYDPVNRIAYGMLGPSGQFIVPGTFHLTSGFINNSNVTVSHNFPSVLNWTNRAQISSIDRAAGVTITWSGGDPSGFVEIKGGSSTLNAQADQLIGGFTCIVPVSDRSFTIPPYILSALPATQTGHPAVLFVSGISSIKRLEGGGLDLSFSAILDRSGSNVTYR